MAEGEKLDLYRQHRDEYVAAKRPRLVKTRPANYLSIAGRGAPEDLTFQEAVAALYGTAFTIKMTGKALGLDFKVAHLEALWWGGDSAEEFLRLPRNRWNWKLLIRMPEFVCPADVKAAGRRLRQRGSSELVSQVKLERIGEGACVQVLHVGPFADEPASIARMERFARGKGLKFSGQHHEIYLSDFRRTIPERLKTVLRHPVRPGRQPRRMATVASKGPPARAAAPSGKPKTRKPARKGAPRPARTPARPARKAKRKG